MIIGICDDDKIWCRHAEQVIEGYTCQTSLEAEIFCFSEKEALLAYEGRPLDVLFLDIVMKEENGIALAVEINKKWKHCKIVYLTNYLHYATEVYETEHIFYALKEQFDVKIGKIFDKILHEMEQNQKSLTFAADGNFIMLAPEEIYYFERHGRITFIETVWGQYRIKEKMGDLEKRLPETDFLRCHNSYIVYLPNIRKADKGSFVMKNGAVILISRSYEKRTKASFTRWMLSQLS
ncbi:MAG: LytTR family DNA-binding domain-containing protein [Candidatus Limivivens sp.]|nr:LytTR family DNA-binding domain-containing protein [Candidatus Limivivens sp.]